MTAQDPLQQLSELVRTHRAALVATARREGLNPEEALECVQDALCTFLTRTGESSDAQWALPAIKLTVRNAARNHRRLHAHAKPHQPIEDQDLATPIPHPDQWVERAEDLVRLQACVAELCTIQRSVVMLRLLEEHSGEDVAEALGLTRNHVDILIHRAKSALRTCMQSSS